MSVLVLVLLVVYLLPTIVAVWLKADGVCLIFTLNALFGWTVVAWVALLYVAMHDESEPIALPQQHYHVHIERRNTDDTTAPSTFCDFTPTAPDVPSTASARAWSAVDDTQIGDNRV